MKISEALKVKGTEDYQSWAVVEQANKVLGIKKEESCLDLMKKLIKEQDAKKMKYAIRANQFGYDIFVQAGGEITDVKPDAFTTDDIKFAEMQAVIFTKKSGYKFEAVSL